MSSVKACEPGGTKIKICGITKPEEAAYLKEFGADYAGFVVFFPKSKRNVSLEQAALIMKELPPGIKRVAVGVNLTISQANAIADHGFDILQLHGAMFPEVAMNSRLPIWRAVKPGEAGEIRLGLRHPKIEAFLLDGEVPGSGQAFDWEQSWLPDLGEKKLILAGGLTPENVEEGIRYFHPFAVDCSSGVEWADKPAGSGKDPEKIRKFIEVVRQCRM